MRISTAPLQCDHSGVLPNSAWLKWQLHVVVVRVKRDCTLFSLVEFHKICYTKINVCVYDLHEYKVPLSMFLYPLSVSLDLSPSWYISLSFGVSI